MDLHKHFRYTDWPSLHTRFANRVSSQLRPLQRLQCQECGCFGPHEHRRRNQVENAPVGAGEYRGDCDALAEESAYREASRRAASRRAMALHQDQKMRPLAREMTASEAWGCGLIATEWPLPVTKEHPIPRWMENMSDYGTWSGSEPTTAAHTRGRSRVMLPPPKWCSRCEVGGAQEAAETMEGNMVPMDNQQMANWYQDEYWPSIKETLSRQDEKMYHLANSGGVKTTPSFPYEQYVPDMNTTYEGQSDQQSNTGPSTPRKGICTTIPRPLNELLSRYHHAQRRIKCRPAGDSPRSSDAVGPRHTRQRRPHSAAPRSLPDNALGHRKRRTRRSASATTVHSEAVALRGTSAERKVTLAKKTRSRGGHARDGSRKPATTPSRRARDERETGSWQGERTAEESEGGLPSPSSRESFRREPHKKSSQASFRPVTPATTEGAPSGQSPRNGSTCFGTPRYSDDGAPGSSVTAGPEEVPAEGDGTTPAAVQPATLPKQEQNKSKKFVEITDLSKLRPTIEDGSDSGAETVSVYDSIDIQLAKHGVKAEFPGEEEVRDDPPKARIPTPMVIKNDPGHGEPGTVGAESGPECVDPSANVPADPSTATSTNADEGLFNVDLNRCLDVILNSSVQDSREKKAHSDDQSGTEPKSQTDEMTSDTNFPSTICSRSERIKKLAAVVTDQMVRAPDARDFSHGADSARDLSAADSFLSTTLSSESTRNCSSSDGKDSRERRRGRGTSKGGTKKSASIHSHREISSVLNRQLKQVRLGVGQLEHLIKLQRFLEEDIGRVKTQDQLE